MTRTQLEIYMKRLPVIHAVGKEELTKMIVDAHTEKDILEAVLTAAKSRGMNLHALKEVSSWRPRERYDDNIYELLKIATGPRAINAKIIILVGMANDIYERRNTAR